MYGDHLWRLRAKERETKLAKRDEYRPVVDAPSSVRELPSGELWHDARGFHVLPEDVRAVRRCDCLDNRQAAS